MKIPKAHAEHSRHVTQSGSGATPKGKAGKRDPFAKILGEMRKEVDTGETRKDSDSGEMRKQMVPAVSALLAEAPNLESPPVTAQTEHVVSTPVPPEIQQLASEIVEQISFHRTEGSRSIEIEFNSQTLEGLRVNVINQQGSISVTFVTPVPWVAGLVRKNLDDLRSALESKGIRVMKLVVRKQTG